MSFEQGLSPVGNQPAAVVEYWLAAFSGALQKGSREDLEDLFEEDAIWRDLASLTGTVGKIHGASSIVAKLLEANPGIKPESLCVSPTFSPPKATNLFHRDLVEAFLEYDTEDGHSVAVIRLASDPEDPTSVRAWLLFTALRSVSVAGKELNSKFASRYGFEPQYPTENWREYRARREAFEDREPEVLVVGGGHNGVAIAAQLEHLGIDTLLVDRLPRLGDVWRNRYHSLALHQIGSTSHLPLMPFPETFPDYPSKDQFGDWIETYAKALDVNAWTSTTLVRARYLPERGEWEATVEREGQERVLRPRHIVMTTGFTGTVPNIPELHGIDDFVGPVVHTAHFKDGSELAGKNVLIVGASTSAHDVAGELVRNGARATMLQRSPINVVQLDTIEAFQRASFPPGVNIEEVDLLFAANLVFPHLAELAREVNKTMLEADAELHDRLEQAGFRVDRSLGGGSWIRGLRNGKGYYINVGGSELVADGTIKVIQHEDVHSFTADGISMPDGTQVPFDAVVLATGFHNIITDVASIFGEDVAEALGEIHILDDKGEGEWSNAWRPTAQPGLWFSSAGPQITRTFSKYLAMQLGLDLRSDREESAASDQMEAVPTQA